MARYVQEIVLNKPDDFVQFMMNDFIHKYDFSLNNWKGEPCYRTGDAFMSGYRYFTWGYQNGVLHLEAWLKGTFGGEMGLTGFYGWAVKSAYKKDVDGFIQLLQQPLPTDGAPYGMPQDGAAVNGVSAQGPVLVQTIDNSRHAAPGLVLGILSIIFALLIPYVGILLSIFGFMFSKKAIHSSRGKVATAGFVCSIIGVAMGFALIFLNAFFYIR